nr:TonB-dependent receptor [uncultured Desulfobulbus sp.]
MKKVLVTGIALAMVSTIAVAEEEQNVSHQNELVVTATRDENRAIDVPISTQIIGQEEIKMSGATDLGQLLSTYVTGYNKQYPGGILNPVGLRGFKTDAHGLDQQGAVLILIDGHRVGTGNAAKINLDRIERVEVIKGPASALYGSAAMGGVINLITKKGANGFGGSVGVEAGSFDYYTAQANVEGRINDKLSIAASISGETEGDYDTVNYGTAYNSGVDRLNIGGNVTYTFNDNHEIRIGGNYSDLEGESVAWVSGNYSSYDPTTEEYSDKSTGYADLEYNGDYFADTVHWKAVLYYLWDKNHWYTGSADSTSDQTKYIQQTLGTDQQLSWKINDWNTVMIGLTVDFMDQESEGVSNYLPSAPSTPDLDYTTQGYFLQDSMDLFDNRLNIILAVRYDRFDIKTSQSKSDPSATFNGIDTDFDHVSPKIGIGMKFFDELLRVRADLGEGFKSPTAGQLGYDLYYGTRHYVGNPNLSPETSLSYNLGFDVYLDAFTFTATYFHTDYEDMIASVDDTVSEPGYTVVNYENVENALITGFDFSLDWNIAKTFDLPFDASIWSNLTINTEKENEVTGKDLTQIADYEVKSGLKLGYKGLSGQLGYTHIGPNMRSSSAEMESFEFWDLTMRYQFMENWEVKAGIYNLTDQDYSWQYGYPMPERNYRLGLTYKF